MAVKSNKFDEITDAGNKFINNIFSKSNFNPITGSLNWDIKDGDIKKNEVNTANIIDDMNNPITTKEQYKKAIIGWFEQYGNQYNVNPNILAAQAFKESTYRTYAYADSSTAMGITQFTTGTIRDVIINNFRNEFTEEEIGKITRGVVLIDGTTRSDIKNYGIIKDRPLTLTNSNDLEAVTAYSNKRNFYQNIIDNPQIMIKAQALLLGAIAEYHNNLAASALFLYFAGPNIRYSSGDSLFKSNNFGDLLDKVYRKSANVYPTNRINDGLEYARKIFNILSEKVGVNGFSFGFDIDLRVVKGNDLFDSSKSHDIRTEPSETAGTIT